MPFLQLEQLLHLLPRSHPLPQEIRSVLCTAVLVPQLLGPVLAVFGPVLGPQLLSLVLAVLGPILVPQLPGPILGPPLLGPVLAVLGPVLGPQLPGPVLAVLDPLTPTVPSGCPLQNGSSLLLLLGPPLLQSPVDPHHRLPLSHPHLNHLCHFVFSSRYH